MRAARPGLGSERTVGKAVGIAIKKKTRYDGWHGYNENANK